MTLHDKHDPHADNKTNGTSSSPTLIRPKGNDREEWATYWQAQNQRWRTEPEVSLERQKYLEERRAIIPDIQKGIYPFGGIKLDRADVEWLLATHENGRGPVIWSDEAQRNREGLDLRGADLSGDDTNHVDLHGLPLARLQGSLTFKEVMFVSKKIFDKALIQLKKANLHATSLEGVNLYAAHLEGANLYEAHLEEANFYEAHLEEANLYKAHLEEANLYEAHLEKANLYEAHLEKADLRFTYFEEAILAKTYLEGADISWAHLEETDLREAHLGSTNLTGIILSKKNSIGPLLVDIKWGATNLAVIDWTQIISLGEEYYARQTRGENGSRKSGEFYLYEYKTAVRANRQLAVALQSQGLNEDASRFAYRANALQRSVFWYSILVALPMIEISSTATWREIVKYSFDILKLRVRALGSFLFSFFLDILAGYGYKPERTLGWYLFVVFGFALLYTFLGHLPFFPDAIVYSLTSFHGRGFLPNLDGQTVSLHTPLVDIAAFEAVVGLLIELSFIATFTQRFFGK